MVVGDTPEGFAEKKKPQYKVAKGVGANFRKACESCDRWLLILAGICV